MVTPLFAHTLIEAIGLLTQAAAEAELLLTKEMQTRHWIEAKHGPNAWAAVSAHYGNQPETTPLQSVGLIAMCGIVNAHQGILGVLQSVKMLNAPPPDLSLGKMRKYNG